MSTISREGLGTAGNRPGAWHTRRCGRSRYLCLSGPEAAARSGLAAEHARSEAGFSRQPRGSAHTQPGPADETGLVLRPASGLDHSGGSDHRHQIRPSGDDHGAGHRERLRQPLGPLSPRAAGLEADRDLRQPGLLGQSRVLLVWNRIVLPDGNSIVLERQPGADAEGYAGLEDGVDYHWDNLLKTAALSTLLGIGAELGSNGDEGDLVRALRRGSQDSINRSGQQLVRRQINVQRTLTIGPGFPVRVIVNRDLVLAQYQGQGPTP
jgi:hypothetical protein